MNDTAKLILKLIATIILIWGIGWLLYENLNLYKRFTPTNYQNILLVIMGAIWFILLLMNVDKDKEDTTQKKENKILKDDEPPQKKTDAELLDELL